MTLIKENKETNPMRAIVWTDYLIKHGVEQPGLAETNKELAKVPENESYLTGLIGMGEFAIDTFGDVSISEWKISEKSSEACLAETEKYVGTPWAEVLTKMSEDAQKF